MKFAVVVVLFALAVGAQSGPVPLAYTTLQSPAFTYTVHQPLHHQVHSSVVALPIIHAEPIVRAVSTVVVPTEGTYVAQTRGAVHVAPLPGHANSASAVNLEPAPGTL